MRVIYDTVLQDECSLTIKTVHLSGEKVFFINCRFRGKAMGPTLIKRMGYAVPTGLGQTWDKPGTRWDKLSLLGWTCESDHLCTWTKDRQELDRRDRNDYGDGEAMPPSMP